MRDEYDETPEPAALWMQLQRERMAQRNFVTPAAPLATRQPQTIDAVPSWAMQTTALDTSRAWQPLQGAREATSAQDRARALRTRLQPFLVAWGAVSVVVGGGIWLVAGALPAGALLAGLTFAGLTAVTYSRLNRQDYEFSREGTEQLRIVEAAQLQREQLEQTHELRKMALESYLQTLERHEGRR